MLYPLKFKPRLKERVWGGKKLIETRSAAASVRVKADKLYGESWELSGVDGDVSMVANGFLKGNNLEEVIEIYMGSLVGDDVFERFGLEFPVLVKYLDCHDKLSVQVHPDDSLAKERHNALGKCEMWYIVSAAPDASIYLGFKEGTTRESYIAALNASTLPSILNRVNVKQGDIFYIPAGTVHAIGGGVEIIEIQQTSDVTYRIYDWDRVDTNGHSRELHTALAMDAIDFECGEKECRKEYTAVTNKAVTAVKSPHFVTSVIDLDGTIERERESDKSFTIYICVDGTAELSYPAESAATSISTSECVLIPAEINDYTLSGKGRFLEVTYPF